MSNMKESVWQKNLQTRLEKTLIKDLGYLRDDGFLTPLGRPPAAR